MRRFAIGLVLATLPLTTLALAGCFNFDEPICAYACGPTTNGASACPDDYECRADGYCHKQGTTDVCGYTDASVGPDLSMDLSAAVDMIPGDLASSDRPNSDAAGTD